MLEILAIAVSQEEEIKGMQIGNKELKVFIFTCYMIANGEHLMESKNTTKINQAVYQRQKISYTLKINHNSL